MKSLVKRQKNEAVDAERSAKRLMLSSIDSYSVQVFFLVLAWSRSDSGPTKCRSATIVIRPLLPQCPVDDNYVWKLTYWMQVAVAEAQITWFLPLAHTICSMARRLRGTR